MLGARCSVLGARCSVLGARCSVLGARCSVRGRARRAIIARFALMADACQGRGIVKETRGHASICAGG
ncbi:hypothetical protein CKO36_02025 [Rhabdochromatium marinum]|nr:hypothetical protein [Rhabdochromatium marinum]